MERAPTKAEIPMTPGEVWALVRRSPIIVFLPGLLAALAALFMVGRQAPVWEASSTLVLRKEPLPRDGSAPPLFAMVQNPEMSNELALLRSRGPAEGTVKSPEPGQPAEERSSHLGLTTLVDDEANSPLTAFLDRVRGRGNEGRLAARATPLVEEAASRVRVRFDGAGGLWLEALEGPWKGTDSGPLPFREGESLEFAGLRLELSTLGNVAEKSFLIRTQIEREAVRSLSERIQASETKPGSGLIRVSYSDSDPHRVAAVVNAYVANYLACHKEQSRERAWGRRQQVEGELERVRQDLREAYDELVRLRQETPYSIDQEQSAKYLTMNLAARTVDHTRAELELTLVEDALAGLREGRTEALSRLAEKTTDGLTKILLQEIGELQAQAQLRERPSSNLYRELLQQRLMKIREGRESLQREQDDLVRTLDSLSRGGLEGLGALSPGAGADVDAVVGLLAEDLIKLDRERTALLSDDYLPGHPEVERLTAAFTTTRDELAALLGERVEAMRGRLDDYGTHAADTEDALAAVPAADVAEIGAALGRFERQVQGNLESLRGGLARHVATLEREIQGYEDDLAALPDSERRQFEPLQRVDNAKARASELLEAREAIQLMAAFAQEPAEVVDPAVPPARRSAPRMGFSLVVAGLLGMFLGLTMAFLLDRTRGSVATPEEFEAALGLGVLGALSSLRLGVGKEGLRALRKAFEGDSSGAVPAAFRALRTHLDVLLSSRDDVRLLGLTSTAAGEGRTVAALGLALSVARTGRKVLLVDADGVANPEGVRRRRGLAQVLRRERGAQEGIAPSGFEGLDLLAAGGSTGDLADAAACAGAAGALRSLAPRYDLVIVDLPSLARGAETQAVARLLDALLFVHGVRTSRRRASAALDKLDFLGVPVLGAVSTRGQKRRRRGVVLQGPWGQGQPGERRKGA